MSESEVPPNRPLLTLSVLGSCLVGVVVQLLAFIYLFQDLCDNVPDDREYCKIITDNSTDNINKTDNVTGDPIGLPYYRGYRSVVGVVLFTEIFTILKVSCKIYCCVKLAVCIYPKCFGVWEDCRCCGKCWYVMATVNVVFNILGIISVCMAVPFSDMMNYIVGFRLGFGNTLFGVVKLACWTGYSVYRHSCCPDSGYFLGSNRRLSGCKITVTVVHETVTTIRTI
ncbi:uncharacterized protein LOC132742984 [Ruditapes philippinarum]|uniref:uncharacterized protein LOC132742984 n=1 Tax=Ruditapes philippinarum TaxID=129788 RepID=UPI00295C1876|nr:uncharacterized protein LOC132742984 [Ruditapes philippinarum]